MGNAVLISVLSFCSGEFGFVPVSKYLTFSLHILIHDKGCQNCVSDLLFQVLTNYEVLKINWITWSLANMSVMQVGDFILMKHVTQLKIQSSDFCEHTNIKDVSLVNQNILKMLSF